MGVDRLSALEAAVANMIDSPIRRIESNRVLVAQVNKDIATLNNDEITILLRVASQTKALREPDELSPKFRDKLKSEITPESAWREAALDVLGAQIEEMISKGDKVSETICHELGSAVATVANLLENIKISPCLLSDSRFIDKHGVITVDERKYSVVTECPGKSIGKKWYGTALLLVREAKREN